MVGGSARRHQPQGQHRAGQLAPRRRPGERPHRLAGVRPEQERHRVAGARRAATSTSNRAPAIARSPSRSSMAAASSGAAAWRAAEEGRLGVGQLALGRAAAPPPAPPPPSLGAAQALQPVAVASARTRAPPRGRPRTCGRDRPADAGAPGPQRGARGRPPRSSTTARSSLAMSDTSAWTERTRRLEPLQCASPVERRGGRAEQVQRAVARPRRRAAQGGGGPFAERGEVAQALLLGRERAVLAGVVAAPPGRCSRIWCSRTSWSRARSCSSPPSSSRRRAATPRPAAAARRPGRGSIPPNASSARRCAAVVQERLVLALSVDVGERGGQLTQRAERRPSGR